MNKLSSIFNTNTCFLKVISLIKITLNNSTLVAKRAIPIMYDPKIVAFICRATTLPYNRMPQQEVTLNKVLRFAFFTAIFA